ncbi:MAG: SHOCT domain-containing protein [Clostridia bacterium]|nr:SHOCT domain-containing protein [Clostridia bacterium]
MNISVKGPGLNKNWCVTDTSITIGSTEYKFNELESFKIITPASAVLPGTAQGRTKEGKLIQCAFKFADRVSATQAIAFVQEKIEEAQGTKKDYKYKLTAHTGSSLEVYDQYLIINHMQVGFMTNAMNGGALGGKKINFKDLTSVQFREPAGFTVGFIQFAYPGSVESKGGISAMINDENSIPIQPSMVEQAREIVNFIEKRRDELNVQQTSTVIQQTSAADELKKFKELLDMGVITQEEFDAKKKEILGL